MANNGDAQAAVTHDGSVDTAAERIGALLAGDGDSSRDEAEEAEQPEEEEDVAAEEQPETDSEDGEADESDGDSQEESEETDEPVPTPKVFTVKVDGKEVAVSEDELKAGYSRTSDYTRKTMQVAEERKALEAEKQTISQEREQYSAVLKVWEQQLKESTQVDEAALAELRRVNPAEYAAVRAELQDRQNRLSQIMSEQQRIDHQKRVDQEEGLKRLLASERESLIKADPIFGDQDKGRAEWETIFTTAVNEYGFKPEEVSQLVDHRLVLLARDAAKYRAIQKKAATAKPQPKPQPVKTATPGPAKQASTMKTSQLTRSKQRLAKTGKVEHAAEILEQLIR